MIMHFEQMTLVAHFSNIGISEPKSNTIYSPLGCRKFERKVCDPLATSVGHDSDGHVPGAALAHLAELRAITTPRVGLHTAYSSI